MNIFDKNKRLFRKVKREAGFILIPALIMTLIGSIIISALCAYMITGLKADTLYKSKADALYAADAGVEDAFWQIKYDNIKTFTDPVAYSPYDYNTTWVYTLSEQVNREDVTVGIKNIWIPQNIPVPTNPAFAANLITIGKLIITGSVIGALTYQIKITYYPDDTDNPLQIDTLGVWLPPGYTYVEESSNLEADDTAPYYPSSVDIVPHNGGQAILWNFTAGSLFTGDEGPPAVAPFPGVDTSTLPLTATITFDFTSQYPGSVPNAISWITTSGVSDIPYAWDADTQIFHINSTANTTQAEAYIARNELRQLQSSIAGDYYATGNSLLSAYGTNRYRSIWHDPSSATVTSANIPADADVAAAYLYWTGWKADTSATTIFNDAAYTLNNWDAGSAWDLNYGRFRGYTYGKTNPDVKLTLKTSLDLSSYASSLVNISFSQSKYGTITASDGLDFAISNDSGLTWSSRIQAFRGPNSPSGNFNYTLPSQFVQSDFKIRFYVVGFSAPNQYCYLDDIKISAMMADTSVVFKIDDGTGAKQVYLDGDDNPQQGTQQLTASRSQVVQNFAGGTTPHGFSYASFRDVTKLVREYSLAPVEPATNYTGYATYWVGSISADTSTHDEWAYASWSLVIIYTSPATQGHRLYLYDRFTYSNQDTTNGINVDFDRDGQPGGTISGFIVPHPVAGEINAGKLTVFAGEGDVWYGDDYVAVNGTKLWDGTNTTGNSESNPNNCFNSSSMGLGTYEGIDIDTLGIDPASGEYITWSSGILQEGDTSAQVDLVTHTDVWNMVYMILSFRSETSTGGSLTYLIKD
ncbi:MAG: hypothetical protein JW967_08880 [Dehalococcoidales bacterium]|nr:hypothetical protein [Dehalococcoidales bacterium]